MKTITLDKHETVVDKEALDALVKFRESIYELAFGDDAINKNYLDAEVIERVINFSNKALAAEEIYNALERIGDL